MAEIGHNGGPPIEPLCTDITSAQKCVGIAIVVLAAKDGITAIGTRELQACASAKDRETVFRATKKLQELSFIRKESERGQGGRYKVLPRRVIDAIVEAYEEQKSGRVEPDRVEDGHPVGSQPTSIPTSRGTLVGLPVRLKRSGISLPLQEMSLLARLRPRVLNPLRG
jgi:hypothetical protein